MVNRMLPMVLIVLIASGMLGIASAQVPDFTFTGSAHPADSISVTTLTPAQMHAAAASFLSQMDQETLSLRHQLDQARKRRDVVKVLCLQDKVKQADTVTSSSRDRIPSLDNAAKLQDLERARHEFTVLEALRGKMRMISMEASQCIGEELGFIDDARVLVEVEPTIPSIDPTRLPTDPIFSDPPMLTSPTR